MLRAKGSHMLTCMVQTFSNQDALSSLRILILSGKSGQLDRMNCTFQLMWLRISISLYLRRYCSATGRSWRSELNIWKDGRTFYTRGWHSLCEVNLIKKEDKCLCEFLIGKGEPVLQIQLKEEEEEEEANLFKSGRLVKPKNPYFIGKIRPTRWHELYIPAKVVKNFNFTLPEKILLRDSTLRSWRSELTTWKDGRTFFTGGGRASLCRVNLIKEEDKCLCEFLLGEGEPVLQIQVVPAT